MTNTLAAESLCADYVAYVRACYRSHPESFRYFEELVDYISPSANNTSYCLQQPSTFVLGAATNNLTPDDLSSQEDSLTPGRDLPSITVVEGHISPACIITLGSKLRVRPEVFIGHLGLMHKLPSKTPFYELPTLPSQRDNVIHLPILCLIKSPIERDFDHPVNALAKDRARADTNSRQAEKDLFNERRYGATRIRRTHMHSQKLISVEQMLSFTVSCETRGVWHGLILLDQGHSDVDEKGFPWSKSKARGRPLGAVPIVPYNAHSYKDVGVGSPAQENEYWASFDQFHPLKNIRTRDEVDHRLLVTDPFFVFANCVTVASTSWNMVLNAIDEDIQVCEQVTVDRLEAGIEQLRFNRNLVDRVELFSAEVANIITLKGSRTWPRATNEQLTVRTRELQQTLLMDQSEIKTRCLYLARRCDAATQMLLSIAQLEQTQRGTEQSQQVNDLTKLAFILVPMSLIVSSFSMNVAELQKPPSVWVVFAFAVPIFLFVMVLLHRQWLAQLLRKLLGAGLE